MMRLPAFRYRAPRTIDDAARWLAESPGDTMLVAGGTDLVPNMKRRQQMPKTLVALRAIAELGEIRTAASNRQPADGFRIGAGVTLTTIVRDERLRASVPGLWQAAAQVATPHLRNMGTLGGNLCLDTRCTLSCVGRAFSRRRRNRCDAFDTQCSRPRQRAAASLRLASSRRRI
jgi:4-hydroxybenzoyl-CoA reductase subunit beta